MLDARAARLGDDVDQDRGQAAEGEPEREPARRGPRRPGRNVGTPATERGAAGGEGAVGMASRRLGPGPQLRQARDRPHAVGPGAAVAAQQDGLDPRRRARRRRPRRRCRRRASPPRERAPASLSAASKIAGDGLRTPTTAEITTPSSSPASPIRSRTSVSDTSQLLTTTTRWPRRRAAISAGRASAKARKRSDASSASVSSSVPTAASSVRRRQRRRAGPRRSAGAASARLAGSRACCRWER